MASNTLLTNQTVTLLFLTPADSRRINVRFQDIRQTGIYEGGYFSDTGGSGSVGNIVLYPLVCEISDGVYQVRIATTSTTTGITPIDGEYVVLRWAYTGDENVDIASVYTTASPLPTDLILAKVSVSSGVSSFDYNDADYPRSTPNTLDLHLKPEAPDAAMIANSQSMKIRVRAGRIQTSSGNVDVADQQTVSAFTSETGVTYGLVYIDDSGVAQITSNAGVTSLPDYAGKRVVAEVTLPDSTTLITQDMIKDVRAFLSPSNEFGSWTAKNDDTIYQAETSGFVIAFSVSDTSPKGFTDGNPDPTGSQVAGTRNNYGGTITFPVRKNDYWKVENCTTVNWLPFGG